MKNIPGLLLLSFVGIFDFTRASGFPEVPAEHIVVEMEDGSHFQGPLKGEDTNRIPIWLQPRPTLPKFYHVFILKNSDARFSSNLQFIKPEASTLLTLNHNQHNLAYGPKYAEIRSGSDHLTARNFEWHERIIRSGTERNSGVCPSRNNVYISLPNGNIYTSVLEPHQADHRENRRGYPTPVLTRMEPLTAVAASSSQNSASGFPYVSPESLVVEMGDDSHFLGPLKGEDTRRIPGWLQPRSELPKNYHVFILKESDARFSSKLEFIRPVISTSLSMNHNQHNLDYGPKYAEIRSGNDYLTARNFHFYERMIRRGTGRNVGVFPSRNHVYISLPNGKIFTSVLETHQADHRENRGEYA